MSITDFFAHYYADTGSTWCERKNLRRHFKEATINEALEKGEAVQYFIKEEPYITMKAMYEMEADLAKRIIDHLFAVDPFQTDTNDDILELISRYEEIESKRRNCEFHLNRWQIEGVINAIKSHLMVLTGGPGTGKTCVLHCIDYCLRQSRKYQQLNIFYSAPTGKASRVLAEATGREAMTLQKRLKMRDDDSEPTPIYGHCLIVDEVSMLDTKIARGLFKAIHPDVKVILVGDVEQLPSVGFGAVLRDLIDSRAIPVTELEDPQRQAENGTLYQNIRSLKKGSMYLTEGEDFVIHDVTGTENIQEMMVEAYMEKIKKYGMGEVACLTPYKRVGETCADILNDILQGCVNGDDRRYIDAVICERDKNNKKRERTVRFKEGDPVIQMDNREEIANGDTGRIINVDVQQRQVTVEYRERCVTYQEEELRQLNLAYAVSVHKAQGSEYACVISAFLPEHEKMLNRNLVYTAVTRAKKEMVMIMDRDTVKGALAKEDGFERVTMLAHLIRDAYTKKCIIASARAFNIQKSVRFLK